MEKTIVKIIMTMKKLSIIAFIFLTIPSLFLSCSKKPDVEYTSTFKMAGDWYVESFVNGMHKYDFAEVYTFNTSDPNSGQLWFDDLENTWFFKGKFDIDYASLSFKPKTGIPNLYASGETIDIVEGKVIPNGGHSKTGVVVDSIYLKAQFSDDPGNTWEFKGHQRTGFFEDEY
jgi:hypothetical protein